MRDLLQDVRFGIRVFLRQPGFTFVVAATLALLTWMDPRLGKETIDVSRRGLDLVFCLDTSRSMLARDLELHAPGDAARKAHDALEQRPIGAGRRAGGVLGRGRVDRAGIARCDGRGRPAGGRIPGHLRVEPGFRRQRRWRCSQ